MQAPSQLSGVWRASRPHAVIKWLTEITVTPEESDNFFHFNDNRVLPEHVTAEIANAEGWWYKPDFIINQLNINSAIAQPGHQELLPLTGKGQTYTVAGYCYTGGGRKVIRGPTPNPDPNLSLPYP